ncbi:MAG: RNA-guided pseudouridylation complex pseudouridine synthase subunit Cbf5 [Methanobacteriota archaeon]|nr:MAG: RNA-guided pseudouridylation complex pseudouridine synthase subunit Cbf5 [Euryarchaeota archaeon]
MRSSPRLRGGIPIRLKKGKTQKRTNTSEIHGPEDRGIEELLKNGVVVIDKPMGPTSHQVTAWVREMLGATRAAHGGTLDPRVTGVLPVGVGVAVRAMDSLHHGTKEYVGVMKMHANFDLGRLEEVFSEFVGEIIQTPPVRSAVKRAPRTREIHSLTLAETSGRNVLFRVECDAGTYIRSLCVDIGDALGIGGHLQDLRRTRAGAIAENRSVTLHDLKDALENHSQGDSNELAGMLRPMEVLFAHMPSIEIKDSAVDAICHGADLAMPGVVSLDDSISKGDTVVIQTMKGEGVGLGKALMSPKEMMARSEGLAVKTMRVFMPTGTYDKGWSSAAD